MSEHVQGGRTKPHMYQIPSSKKCWTCRRRRIRCDGALPHCYACKKSGRECLGYGKLFRWTNVTTSQRTLNTMTPGNNLGHSSYPMDDLMHTKPERHNSSSSATNAITVALPEGPNTSICLRHQSDLVRRGLDCYSSSSGNSDDSRDHEQGDLVLRNFPHDQNQFDSNSHAYLKYCLWILSVKQLYDYYGQLTFNSCSVLLQRLRHN